MDDSSELSPVLDRQRRQHAHRCRQVTKAQKKIASLINTNLGDVNMSTIDTISEELATSVTGHDALQDRIEELLLGDPEASEAELIDRDKHTELHADLRRTLKTLSVRLLVWLEGQNIEADLDSLMSVVDKLSPTFRSMMDSFQVTCRKYMDSAATHMSHPLIRDRIHALRN